MAFALIALLIVQSASPIPPRGKYNHTAEILIRYDRFQDGTMIGHTPLPVSDAPELKLLSVATFFHYEGQIFKMPPIVTMLFTSYSGDWRFLRERGLIVLADSKRIDLGEAKRIESKVMGRNVKEVLSADMPTDDFLRIVNARSVEVQLGVIEFRLADSAREAMRDVASRLRE